MTFFEKIKHLVGRPSVTSFFPKNDTNIALSHSYHYPVPSFYYVDICNICNLHCFSCPTGQQKPGLTKGRMTIGQYSTILNKISPYAKQIHLYNWGEPFLNKDILPIISMTAEKKIFTSVHSNLTMRDFTKDEAEGIVRSGLSFLNVSLDGASQETYQRYRIGGDFDRVIRNIQRLQDAKSKVNIDMSIRWRFLINAFNVHEQEKAIALAHKLGVIMQFDLMGVTDKTWATKFHDKKNPQKWPVVNFYKEVPYEINLVPPPPIQLHPRLKYYCIQPFDWMTVNSNGDVTPCCAVYGDQYSIGNIFDDSLEQVWNGPLMQQCRKYLSHYGARQNGTSICETKPCTVKQKFVNDGSGFSQADIEVLFLSGVWSEEGEDWLWLSDQAEFSILPKHSGILTFDFIGPDQDHHKKMLPILIDLWVDSEKLDQVTIEKAGSTRVSCSMVKGKTVLIRTNADKYFVPDQILGNGDKRRLSLIVDNFTLHCQTSP